MLRSLVKVFVKRGFHVFCRAGVTDMPFAVQQLRVGVAGRTDGRILCQYWALQTLTSHGPTDGPWDGTCEASMLQSASLLLPATLLITALPLGPFNPPKVPF